MGKLNEEDNSSLTSRSISSEDVPSSFKGALGDLGKINVVWNFSSRKYFRNKAFVGAEDEGYVNSNSTLRNSRFCLAKKLVVGFK